MMPTRAADAFGRGPGPAGGPAVAARRFSAFGIRAFFEAFYAGFERALIGLGPVLARIGFARLERPVAAVEKAVKVDAVRLPHVRPVHPVLDRHVLPDELPQDPAQRPLRRRARRTAIAKSIRRWPASGSRPTRAASQMRARRARSARSSRRSTIAGPAGRHGSRSCAAMLHPDDYGDDPGAPLIESARAIPRADGSSGCCGAANSPSPPSSTRPTRPIPRTSTSAPPFSRAGSTASTPPTARAPIATCRASPSARC